MLSRRPSAFQILPPTTPNDKDKVKRLAQGVYAFAASDKHGDCTFIVGKIKQFCWMEDLLSTAQLCVLIFGNMCMLT